MKKTGRPKGAKPELWGTCAGAIDTLNCIGWKRREPSIDGESSSPHPSTSLAPYTPPASSPKPRPSRGTGTASRKKLYLLDMVEDTFRVSKLPKSAAVLHVFLLQLEDTSDTHIAAQNTISQLKEVWLHHFQSRRRDANALTLQR